MKSNFHLALLMPYLLEVINFLTEVSEEIFRTVLLNLRCVLTRIADSEFHLLIDQSATCEPSKTAECCKTIETSE